MTKEDVGAHGKETTATHFSYGKEKTRITLSQERMEEMFNP